MAFSVGEACKFQFKFNATCSRSPGRPGCVAPFRCASNMFPVRRRCFDDDVDVNLVDDKLVRAIQDAARCIERDYPKVQIHVKQGFARLAGEQATDSTMTVALCTATKKRLEQLKLALPFNLLHAWPHRKWVKIHLTVCDDDKTLEWVLENCQAAMQADLLRVYDTKGNMKWWHASIAKNTSHIVAREQILINLDGDNFIGPGFPAYVVEKFKKGYCALRMVGSMCSRGFIIYRVSC